MNFFDRQASNFAQNMIICVEMVFAAVAQSFAFSYVSFIDGHKKKGNMLRAIGYVLNVKDVLSDAHNTFIKDTKDKDVDTQMDDILKDKAFNWSDEELAQIETGDNNKESPKLKKPKYKKG